MGAAWQRLSFSTTAEKGRDHEPQKTQDPPAQGQRTISAPQIMSRFAFILKRLQQPSTWAALAGLSLLAGKQLPPELVGAGPDLVALAAGALGVALNEQGPPGPV